MRWKFVAQAELFGRLVVLCLFAQGTNFTKEQVYLLLLAENEAIQVFDEVFGVADLDFKFGNARFHKLSLFFTAPVAQGFLGWRRGYVVSRLPYQRQSATQYDNQADAKNNPAFVHVDLRCEDRQCTWLLKKSRRAVDIGFYVCKMRASLGG